MAYTIQQEFSDIQEVIRQVRVQDYHSASLALRHFFSNFLTGDIPQECMEYLPELEQLLAANDMIYTADWLESVWLPLRQASINLHPVTPARGHFVTEPTSSGWLTLKNTRTDKYYHSNVDPVLEAKALVDKVYNPEYEVYAVWGCGLGYHIKQLYEVSMGAIQLHIFYENPEEYALLQEYGVLQDIPSERLHFTQDDKAIAFTDFISSGNCDILLHLPSVLSIRDDAVRTSMHTFFGKWNSAKQMRRTLAINFRSNVSKCTQNVDSISEKIKGRDVIILGGGPSLDNGMEYVKQMQGQKIILAATTVLRKLVAAGIRPDYTVVSDPQSRTLGHLANLPDHSVPMLITSTAYWQFADIYEGEKYLICQKQYAPAEELAARYGYFTYDTGGTVTSLSIELALSMNASGIELLGVDLSYPGGVSHAGGTMDRHTVDTSGMYPVEDVNGGTSYADILFVGYRKWIENKIADYPNIPVINLSNCGTKIKGTTHKNI